ncbi:MAG: SEC-C metal-binding domain-containing protein, partial [Oscillospiraceae bacterium]
TNDFSYAMDTAATKKCVGSLADCLLSKNKKALSDIGKEYKIEKLSTLKKAEIVEKLEKLIPEKLSENVKLFGKDIDKVIPLLEIEKVANCKKTKGINITELIRLGLVYSYTENNEVYITMPEEILEKLNENKSSFNKETAQKFIKGIISIYGAYSINSLVMSYNSFTGESLSASEVEKIAKALKTLSIKNEFIFDKAFAKNEKKQFENMLENLKKGLFFKASFEDIMAYSDEYYYEETAELTHLKKFVTEYVTGKKDITDQIIATIVHDHRRSARYSIENYTNVFLENGYGFRAISTESKVVTLLVEAINTVRMWAYSGYTVLEIKKIKLSEMSKNKQIRAKIPLVSEKIGRNDPCPCGSGQKYKKCCGKLA